MRTAAWIILLVGLPWPAPGQVPSPSRATLTSVDSTRAGWIPIQIHNRSPSTATEVDSPSVIYFHNGKRFQTGLFQVQFQGLLPTSGTPYLVLSGRGCTECDANITLYILSPVGPPAKEATVRRFWISGRETDRQTRKVIRSSRAFVGECLPDLNDVLISYDSLVDAAGHWHTGLFIARIVADTIAEDLRLPPPPIMPTVALVRAGRCREIAQINQSTEP